MMVITLFIIVQALIALVVLGILKYLLDRELEKAAVEKLLSLKVNSSASGIHVYHGNPMPSKVKSRLTGMIRRKFLQDEVRFEQLQSLKGGLMIKVADEVLDFSVASRLEHLWS